MKSLKVTVNGIEYDVKVEEIENSESNNISNSDETNLSQSDAKPSKSDISTGSNEDSVKSPMPGTILSVEVKNGDKVSKGQVLLILEAMKMENEIVSPKDGIVANVHVKKGENVESGSHLVDIK